MSYAKAMKHWKNPRKWKKTQPILCCGHGSPTRAPDNSPERRWVYDIRLWFRERNDGRDKQHVRECIREAIIELRSIRAERVA